MHLVAAGHGYLCSSDYRDPIEAPKAWDAFAVRGSRCNEGADLPVAITGERDQPAPMQEQWTPRLVQQRLREAFAVEQRLPDSGRPRGQVSFWPAAQWHSFTEMLHWTDARERVWQSWARSKGGVHAF